MTSGSRGRWLKRPAQDAGPRALSDGYPGTVFYIPVLWGARYENVGTCPTFQEFSIGYIYIFNSKFTSTNSKPHFITGKLRRYSQSNGSGLNIPYRRL